MPQRKHQQRVAALARRDIMTQQERLHAAQTLVTHNEALINFGCSGKIVSGFWPIRSEIDPRPLMFALQEQGSQLALPALIGSGKDRRMVFRQFAPDQPLIPMGFDTFGPDKIAEIVDPQIVLLPLAAFDDHGNRIGYGGGFYDRTIAHMHRNGLTPRLIGLAFDCQEMETIAAEPHDIKLEAILTESGLRIFAEKLQSGS